MGSIEASGCYPDILRRSCRSLKRSLLKLNYLFLIYMVQGRNWNTNIRSIIPNAIHGSNEIYQLMLSPLTLRRVETCREDWPVSVCLSAPGSSLTVERKVWHGPDQGRGSQTGFPVIQGGPRAFQTACVPWSPPGLYSVVSRRILVWSFLPDKRVH